MLDLNVAPEQITPEQHAWLVEELAKTKAPEFHVNKPNDEWTPEDWKAMNDYNTAERNAMNKVLWSKDAWAIVKMAIQQRLGDGKGTYWVEAYNLPNHLGITERIYWEALNLRPEFVPATLRREAKKYAVLHPYPEYVGSWKA